MLNTSYQFTTRFSSSSPTGFFLFLKFLRFNWGNLKVIFTLVPSSGEYQWACWTLHCFSGYKCFQNLSDFVRYWLLPLSIHKYYSTFQSFYTPFLILILYDKVGSEFWFISQMISAMLHLDRSSKWILNFKIVIWEWLIWNFQTLLRNKSFSNPSVYWF